MQKVNYLLEGSNFR